MIDLEHLKTASRDVLLMHWQTLFKTPPPRFMGRNVLCGIIAFEVQSKQSTGLDRETIKAMKHHHNALNKKTTPSSPAAIKLKTGSRLMREWNGATHVIEVADNAYMFQGTAYKSLSSIAKVITGAHWSGPRFFGLNKSSQAA